jgi:uncharacterized protein (TIGR02145 family)
MKNLLMFGVFVSLRFLINAQTVTDIDGNVYNTVTIGTQVWMAENLKVTHYSDGTPVACFINTWESAYWWYNDDSTTYAQTYGALYNSVAANRGSVSRNTSGIQGVCPTDWHVPSLAEWTVLIDYLGGAEVAGGKLKETGTTHWSSPNTGATNETGFTALPGGMWINAIDSIIYSDIGNDGNWWSCTMGTMVGVESLHLNYNISDAVQHILLSGGISVRCLKDNNTSIPNSINSEEVIFYPNPATEKLFIKNGNYTNRIIMIFDLQGKQVLSKQMDSNPIDISNLEKGINVIKLVGSENVIITKFIKE